MLTPFDVPHPAPVYEHDLWTRPERVASPDDGMSDADDYSWPDGQPGEGYARLAAVGGFVMIWIGLCVTAFGHFVGGWW